MPAQLSRSALLPVLLGAALFAAAPARAQVPVGTPGAPAGAVLPPQGTPIPNLAPPDVPRVGPGTQTPGPVPAAPGVAGAVAVRAVRVDGATAFPADQLLGLAGPLTGPAVPLARIEEARTAILNRYREAGYVFTVVDATVERDGTLRLVVGESEVTEVRLDGDIGPAGTQVLRFLNNLVGQRPLDAATLERWLLLASDVPGVALRSVLRPAGTVPGALSLVAQVGRQAVNGYVTADNRSSRVTGPEEFLGAAQFNSFTSLGERSELALYYASGLTQIFGQASTEFFIGGSGLRARLYAGRGDANPSGALRALGYEGETTVAGGSLSYPLIRQRQQTLLLSGTFDALETEIRVDGNDGREQRLSRDSLRVIRLGADWAVYDLLLGDARPAANTVVARLSQGLSAFGASRDGASVSAAGLSRTGAQVDFTKIVVDATRAQTLFSPWPDATLTLQATIAGQYSADVLPQAEKFYLGGNRLGRGFFSGEVTGDKALAGSIELQLATLLETQVLGRPVRIDPVLYAFYDVGQTWENRREDSDRYLSSVGLGARMRLTEYLELQLEGVHRNTRRPSGGTAQKADALFWRVLARF
ncbi:ShlB/FhaC/HecB family hemolysin secretion/activation protein [Roseomonas sp. BN140053]|uniref:ShlB/FhaC/HecB family hemolysin secretion/activation protein n=1 Tax=Roseomonas sp. BN140053 TaxID=3391898 RepID=UPI0039E741BC